MHVIVGGGGSSSSSSRKTAASNTSERERTADCLWEWEWPITPITHHTSPRHSAGCCSVLRCSGYTAHDAAACTAAAMLLHVACFCALSFCLLSSVFFMFSPLVGSCMGSCCSWLEVEHKNRKTEKQNTSIELLVGSSACAVWSSPARFMPHATAISVAMMHHLVVDEDVRFRKIPC